ncbi:hypothetical protein [Mycolicibacterium sarraceniae]|uniref:Uncharacterized protein n=1 Tax=Mycolicibacterium sarraceniae TaxID=1534348 RepID=A0A7I7SY50_9MYCO|nr:hypothetical protein [Mycolicibacterium sarraceniae]BBY61550.1 hypothetical protein MSAR_46860 [Mycolicibacterium sarraceniae]
MAQKPAEQRAGPARIVGVQNAYSLLIPGTGSVGRLEENAAAGSITRSTTAIAELDDVPSETLAHGDGVEAFFDEG